MKHALLKNVSSGILILLSVPGVSGIGKLHAELPPEAADPDAGDMSVWKNIKPGIHSGFGSMDVAYSKNIPPAGNVAESIKLHGWKGERVHCQLLVWSAGGAENVSIKASGFSGNPYEIDMQNVSISVVRYVLTDGFPGWNDRKDKNKFPVLLKPNLLSKTNCFDLDAPGSGLRKDPNPARRTGWESISGGCRRQDKAQ